MSKRPPYWLVHPFKWAQFYWWLLQDVIEEERKRNG